MTTAPMSLDDEIAKFVHDWGVSRDVAAQKVSERKARERDLAETTDSEILLPAVRDRLKLRAKIERIVKTIATPAHYRIETDAGRVTLGPANRWATRPAEFSAAFLDICEMPQLPKDRDQRNDLCAMIARAAEREDNGEEATETGWTRVMLRGYLEQRPPVDTTEEAVLSEYPFTDDGGHIVLFAAVFRRWLLLNHQERLSAGDCGRRLRSVGCEPDKVNTVIDDKRTSRGVWRLPADLE